MLPNWITNNLVQFTYDWGYDYPVWILGFSETVNNSC